MSLDDYLIDDLDTFFAADEFGVEAVVDGETINAILDDEYVEDLDVAGTRPILICRTDEVEEVVQGDSVTIGETNYQVIATKPDGTGVTRLVLEEV